MSWPEADLGRRRWFLSHYALLWPLDPGIASLVSGVWPLVLWALEAVLWPLAFGLWPLAFRLDLFCSTAIRLRTRMFVRCFRARMFVRCFALIVRSFVLA